MKRYEIYWAVLEPTIGMEIKKTRPCVIVSPNTMNDYMPRVIIAPITSTIHVKLPFRHTIHHGGQDRDILLDQIRTLDKRRLQRKAGKLADDDAAAVSEILVQIFTA